MRPSGAQAIDRFHQSGPVLTIKNASQMSLELDAATLSYLKEPDTRPD